MTSCFDLSLAVVAHKVLNRNATLMVVKHTSFVTAVNVRVAVLLVQIYLFIYLV